MVVAIVAGWALVIAVSAVFGVDLATVTRPGVTDLSVHLGAVTSSVAVAIVAPTDVPVLVLQDLDFVIVVAIATARSSVSCIVKLAIHSPCVVNTPRVRLVFQQLSVEGIVVDGTFDIAACFHWRPVTTPSLMGVLSTPIWAG